MIPVSYKEAKSQGARYFFGGQCKHGSLAPRLVSDRHCTCRACADEKTEKRRLRHQESPEKYKAIQLEWGRLRRERHREFERLRTKEWRSRNPDKHTAHNSNRRARKLNATPPWFGELDRLAIVEAADLAKRREAITGYAWQIDHMIPLQARQACGLHCAANLQVIPASLNSAKMNKLKFIKPLEWLT